MIRSIGANCALKEMAFAGIHHGFKETFLFSAVFQVIVAACWFSFLGR
jgi:hypothetical protein